MKRAFSPSWIRHTQIGGKYRNKFSVFLICVAISFFMWGLIKLTRVYEAPVRYRVKFEQIPNGKVIVGAQDSIVTLYLKGRGLDLYSKILQARKNIIGISLAGIRLTRDGDQYHGQIRTSRLMQAISQQLTQDAELLGIQPDTLGFVFETEYRRKVPVRPDLSLSFADQFQLYDSLKISPDSVIIYGIKSIIDTLYVLNTEPQSVKSLKANRDIKVKLLRPETTPQVRLSRDSITVNISVERFTEASIEVPVGLEEPEQGTSFRTFPEKVTLTCRVAMREYERLDPTLFSVGIDHVSATASGNNLAEVHVMKQPTFAKVIRIRPEKVEFLILK